MPFHNSSMKLSNPKLLNDNLIITSIIEINNSYLQSSLTTKYVSYWLSLTIIVSCMFSAINYGFPSPVTVRSDFLCDKSRSRYPTPCGHTSRTEASCVSQKQSQIYRDDLYPLIPNLLNIKSKLFCCTHLYWGKIHRLKHNWFIW